ncbi:hypothetical protein RB199_11275 [Streptomyces libani]
MKRSSTPSGPCSPGRCAQADVDTWLGHLGLAANTDQLAFQARIATTGPEAASSPRPRSGQIDLTVSNLRNGATAAGPMEKNRPGDYRHRPV